MQSREPMRPSRHSVSSTSQPGLPKRSSSVSVVSSTEIVPSKSQRRVQSDTCFPYYFLQSDCSKMLLQDSVSAPAWRICEAGPGQPPPRKSLSTKSIKDSCTLLD